MRFVLVRRMWKDKAAHICITHSHADEQQRAERATEPMVGFTKMIIELKIFIFRGYNQHDATCAGTHAHNFSLPDRHRHPSHRLVCVTSVCDVRSFACVQTRRPKIRCHAEWHVVGSPKKIKSSEYFARFADQRLLPLVSVAIVFAPLTRSQNKIWCAPNIFSFISKLTRCQWASSPFALSNCPLYGFHFVFWLISQWKIQNRLTHVKCVCACVSVREPKRQWITLSPRETNLINVGAVLRKAKRPSIFGDWRKVI